MNNTNDLIDFTADADVGIATLDRVVVKKTGAGLFDIVADLAFSIVDLTTAGIASKYAPGLIEMYRAGLESEDNIDGVRKGLTSGVYRGRPQDNGTKLEIVDVNDEGHVILQGEAKVRRIAFGFDGAVATYTVRVGFPRCSSSDVGDMFAALDGSVEVVYAAAQLDVANVQNQPELVT